MRNPSCKKGWTMSCKEKLTHATSHSEVRSTILSEIPALWHHQLFKSQWADRKENAGNALMTSLNMASSCDLPSLEDIGDKTHSLLKGRTLPSYPCSTFLLSPLRAGICTYSCLMHYWKKLPSRGSVVVSIKAETWREGLELLPHISPTSCFLLD